MSFDTLTLGPRWWPLPMLRRGWLPADRRCWLLDPGSLTRRLRRACSGRFGVEVLRQGWERPLFDEARALDLADGRHALVRQVRLYCDDVPWVYARTVIPAATLTGPRRRLAHLGRRPLGAMLFSDPTMRRGGLEVARVAPDQRLHALAGGGDATLWGRRTVFTLAARPLLVSEIFLPAVGDCPEARP